MNTEKFDMHSSSGIELLSMKEMELVEGGCWLLGVLMVVSFLYQCADAIYDAFDNGSVDGSRHLLN